jgi:hypothetical protein
VVCGLGDRHLHVVGVGWRHRLIFNVAMGNAVVDVDSDS